MSVSQCPAHSGRRHFGLDPKKVSTPVHGADVLHSGRLGADEVDGVCEEGADDVEGTVYGADEGFNVGRTEGVVEGMDEGIDVGYDDVDGLGEGMKEGVKEGADDTDGSVEGTVAHPAPKTVDSSNPKSPPPSRMTSLS